MDSIACGARRTLLERRAALARVARDGFSGAQDVRGIPGEASEVEAALARIEEGIYGLCEGCAGAIGRLRLRAIPEARLCVTCSAERRRR